MSIFEARLNGGLWHTTRPDLFATIMSSGGLTAEPEIPDGERWKTSRGPDYYPFVRTIGGVSLFDFREFDPDAYARSHPMSNWTTFVPHVESWGGAVWIEIDSDMIAERFVSGGELVRRWDEGGHHRHTIMPRIEAAAIGEVPVAAFSSAFLTWNQGREIRAIDLAGFDPKIFDVLLHDWRAFDTRGTGDEVTI